MFSLTYDQDWPNTAHHLFIFVCLFLQQDLTWPRLALDSLGRLETGVQGTGTGCISNSEPLYFSISYTGLENRSDLRNLTGNTCREHLLQTTSYRDLKMTRLSCLKVFPILPRLYWPDRRHGSCAMCVPSRLVTTVLHWSLLGAMCREAIVVLLGAQWALSFGNSVQQ